MNLWNLFVRLSRTSHVQIRLIVSFLLLSTIPVGITGIIAYNKSNQAISSKTSTFVTNILQLQANKMRAEVTKYVTFADQIMLNANIQNALRQYDNMNDLDRAQLHKQIEDNVLQNNFWVFATMKSLQIQTGDGQVLYDSGYVELNNEDMAKFRDRAKQSESIDTWTIASTRGGVPMLALVRKIPPFNGANDPRGYLIMGIDEQLFSQIIFSDVDMGKDSDQILMDGSGEILTSQNHTFLTGAVISQEDPQQIWMEPKQTTGHVITKVGRYFAVNTHIEEFDWNLIGLIPLTYLNTESKEIQTEIIMVVFLCIIFSLLFTMLISSGISSPLKKLVKGMNQVMNGDLQISIRDDGRDEIGYLSNKFNDMIDELRLSMERIKMEQAQKRETELQMLQAQINPHFLFNTLNSLKWTAMLSQADSVSKGLSALAELLRSTIVNKDERISLRDELRNISNYMIIQKVRYGTTLRVEYFIADEWLDAQVLKFLLQPIVENAIIHGLEGVEREPKITISVKRIDNELEIVLGDNGKGIAKEKMLQLLDSSDNLSKNRLANIGIGNVRERIRLHYGEAYGLTIFSELNQGTDIVIRIPYIQTVREE